MFAFAFGTTNALQACLKTIARGERFKHKVFLILSAPTIYGNNEITCGNSYSTLWDVMAWADSNTKETFSHEKVARN
jgi:hypothetical protein